MENQKNLPPIELRPDYSTTETPGRCVKCLAEHELNKCLMELLKGTSSEEVAQRYEALVTFLESPEMNRVRVETENCLAEGKRVKVEIFFEQGKPRCRIVSIDPDTRSGLAGFGGGTE